MKALYIAALLTSLSLLISCNPKTKNKLNYIDQVYPTTTPILFSKGFISKDTIAEYGSVFNETATEFFFAIDSAGRSFIKHTQLKNNKWTTPRTIIADPEYTYNDPFLSNDENQLYYISDQPRNAADTIKDIDIWYSTKTNQQWSEPINAGAIINSDKNEFYISFSEKGSMYFASNKDALLSRKHNFDIYKSEWVNGAFQRPQKLSAAINTKGYEADVFIAPDERYIIFCAARRSAQGRGDLFISFKNDENQWSPAINMGDKINTKNHEICPFVSKDGKYLFYTSNQDIYWVSTAIIDEIKAKNLANKK